MNRLGMCIAFVAIVACSSPKLGNDTATTRSSAISDTSASQTDPQSGFRLSGNSVNEDATHAAKIVQRYYAAIAAHDYDSAYALWEQSGKASGKTRAEFAAGFARTGHVEVTINGTPQMGAAAGSQYVTVPVIVDAVESNGQKQRFTGTYTVRRAMVDGATPEQREWHIYSAELTPSP